jgi:hypothetical protein
VILSRIWGEQELDLKSWAVQREPEDPAAKTIEETLWGARGDVDLVYSALHEYIAGLSAAVFGVATEQVGS